ncbi:MAG: type 4a pilus biogenesis protein PilO [Candidatus Omnitrophica bacterium]|nr:type 4a pilus biogenesis protein PilO [Candidatus Omnitrophota bacterium]
MIKFIAGLSLNEKKILGIAGIFILLALFDRLLIAPSWDRLQEIEDSITKEESRVSQNMHFLAYRERIKKEAESFKDFYAKDVRTEEEIIGDLLKQVEGMASSAKVELSKVTPAGKDEQKDYIKYLVTVDAVGKFEDITSFIYSINNSKELMKVEKMTIAGNARDAEKVQVNMSVSKMIVGEDPSKDVKAFVKANEEAKDAADQKSQK